MSVHSAQPQSIQITFHYHQTNRHPTLSQFSPLHMTTTHFPVPLSTVDWHQYCLLSCQFLKYRIQRCSDRLYLVLTRFIWYCSNSIHCDAQNICTVVLEHSIFWWLTLCIVVLEQFYSETPQIWVQIFAAPKYKFRLNLVLTESKCSSVCSAWRFLATSRFVPEGSRGPKKWYFGVLFLE